MAGKDLQITVGVVDKASGAFSKIGKSGKQAAQDITQSTAQAAQSVSKLDASLTSGANAAKNYASAGQQIGVGLAALGAGFTGFARSVVDNERQLATLERTYGTATSAMKSYADQIQATTVYSSEAAVASENIFGTLARNYGLQADEIQRLVQVSTDLAATSGLGLEDVSTRVAAAIRGEAESAEVLGLTMNQAAIDQDNLTLSMSNQEAAAFRLSALYDQVGFASGAAAAQADTTAGRIKQLGNEFEDLGRSIVGMTGPLGPAVAGITSFGLSSGASIAGLASIAKGLRDVTKEAGGVRSAVSLAGTAIGPGGILVAGLGLATVGAIALYRAFNDDLPNAFDVAADGVDDVDIALKTLISTMDDVNLAIDLSEGQRQFNSLLDVLNEYNAAKATAEAPLDQVFTPVAADDPNAQAKIDAQNAALAESIALNQEVIEVFGSADAAADMYRDSQIALTEVLKNTAPGAREAQQSIADLYAAFDASDKGPEALYDLLKGIIDTAGNLPAYTADMLAAQAANEGLAESFDDLTTSLFSTNTILAELIRTGASGDILSGFTDDITVFNSVISTMNQSLTGDELKQWQDDFKALSTYVGPAADVVEQRLHDLNIMLMAGVLSPEAYRAAVHALGIELGALEDAAIIADETIAHMGDSFAKAQKSIGDLSEMIGKGADAFTDYVQSTGNAAREAGQLSVEQDKLNATLGEFNGVGQSASRTIEANELAHVKLKDALLGTADGAFEAMATLEEFNAQFDAAASSVAGYSDTLRSLQDAGFSGPELDLAVNLQISQDSLENVNRVIIGQTNSMSQQLDGVKSWADTLIGDPGVWSDMDKLLADGRINAEQYADAQEAQIRISQDVTNAQEDLKAVQVSLAPVMADAVRQQAEYIDSLQNMGPEAQLAALGMMDQATSTKALGLAQLAASATTEEMRNNTEDLIEQAAAADPALRAVLESMGLIDGTTGEVHLDASAAEKANTAISDLAGEIGDLADVLAQIFGIDIDYDDVGPARGEVQGLIDDLGILDGSNADPDVTINNQATGEILAIAGQLLALPESKDIYVNTHMVTIYETRGDAFAAAATGTTMHEFATGGTLFDQFKVDIPHYGMGGGHAIVGEYGPEMVWLPNGSQVTNHPATMSKLESVQKRRGGNGDVINRGVIIVQPASSDIEPAIRQKLLAGIRR